MRDGLGTFSIGQTLIIVQCLNWNMGVMQSYPYEWILIIVQCLNWNVLRCRHRDGFCTYNRTMLELKFQFAGQSIATRFLIIVQCLNWNVNGVLTNDSATLLIIVQCLNWNSSLSPEVCRWFAYNRTMLELKSLKSEQIRLPHLYAYNRTMLELKYPFQFIGRRVSVLIIVQCLNWNSATLMGVKSDE